MPLFESCRKVQAFGSSLALTLPAMFVKIHEIQKGSVINILYNLNGVLIASQIEDLEDVKKRMIEIIEKIENETKKQGFKKDNKK